MTAIREEIFVGIETAFLADTGAAEVERMPSGDPIKFNALHIYDEGHSRDAETEAQATRYRLQILVEGFVEGIGGADAHAQLSALYAAMLKSLMTFADNSPHIEEIEEGSMRVAVAKLASKRRLAFSHDFVLTYVTRRGEPDPT